MFDIVTVCYHDDARLTKTLESLQRLQFPGQIIIQDGSCLASTEEVVSNFPTLCVRHVRAPDDGLYDAMNRAAKLVSSSWFLTLNCGDILLTVIDPEAFQVDLVLCDVVLRSRGGKEKFPARPEKIHSYMSTCHQGILFSKLSFERFGGYDTSFKIAADYDLMRRMLPRCKYHVEHLELTEFEGFNGMSERYRWALEMETASIRYKNGAVLSYFTHAVRYIKFKLLNGEARK